MDGKGVSRRPACVHTCDRVHADSKSSRECVSRGSVARALSISFSLSLPLPLPLSPSLSLSLRSVHSPVRFSSYLLAFARSSNTLRPLVFLSSLTLLSSFPRLLSLSLSLPVSRFSFSRSLSALLPSVETTIECTTTTLLRSSLLSSALVLPLSSSSSRASPSSYVYVYVDHEAAPRVISATRYIGRFSEVPRRWSREDGDRGEAA